MKTISILTFLFAAFMGFSQSLPESFESSITTANFIDFDGGVATVLPNPQQNGINTSATVGRIVRNGGQIWAGSKYTLAANLDFTTLSVISMKVFTTAPVGTMVKFKLEGVGQTEVDAVTTASGAWHTLTWNFAGTPTNFNQIVLMFDFGNIGNGSANSTFYFDDITQSAPTLSQINLPVTFENAGVNYTMTDFGNNMSTMMADPTNPANMVMQVIKPVSAPLWAGTTISTPSGFASTIPFTASNTTMTVKVWSPTAGTPIRLKVEQVGNPGISCETQVNTTLSGAWETLTFDFLNQVVATPALNVANTYNMASIFFNFGTDGATAGSQTYYFDDVYFGAPAVVLSQIDLPVTFESATVDYTMTDFGNNMSTMMADPTNPANMVMQVIKPVSAPLWAGTTISTPSGFASTIPFTASNTTMTVKVWSPTAGTPIRLKVEVVGNPTQSCETEVNTTVAGAWETLTFDFTNQAPGTAALNLAYTFNMASIFFNFGTDGATAGSQTYYFDDVYFGSPVVVLSQIDLPVTFESSTVDYTVSDFGGNTSTLMADPTNPANTVMQSIKGAGAQTWAGTTIGTPAGFANAIPFTVTETYMNVKVWSPTAGTPIRLKVEDAANGAISVETESTTTAAGAWETLTFNFANQAAGTAAINVANTYDKASIFFNFGTDGATAGSQTYYFDDVMFGQPAVVLSQIDLPVTFESSTVDYTVTDFGGNASIMMADPTNPANTVMQSIKGAGAQTWAGTTIGTPAGFATAIPFTVAETFMTVKVWSPTAGTPIRLKVEDVTNGAISCETEANTTAAGAWETLTFNFANPAAGTAALDINNTYDKASIFFNFGTDGATAGAQTYYFDDVEFGAPVNPLDQIDLPVTFELSTVDYTMTDFGGNASIMVVDPTNPANMVMEVEKTGAAQTWAGTTIGTAAGFVNEIPFTATETFMSVRVWSPTAGTPIRLKVEDAADGTISCETDVNTTMAGAWETLVFNFANQVAGTSALDITNTYDKASIFFNFGTDGATAGAQTYYFDDVMFGDPFAGTAELNNFNLSVYPNPTNTVWNLRSEKSDITAVRVFNIQGELIYESTSHQAAVNIDATSFSAGVYIAYVSTSAGTQVVRMVRN